MLKKDVRYSEGMPRFRIVDCGFEAVINVFPRIGDCEICEILDRIHTRLYCGHRVCLADVQEGFGLKRTKYGEKYILHETFDTDWYVIWDDREPVGVSIVISNVYKERKQQKCGMKKSEIQKPLTLPWETVKNGQYEQLEIQL